MVACCSFVSDNHEEGIAFQGLCCVINGRKLHKIDTVSVGDRRASRASTSANATKQTHKKTHKFGRGKKNPLVSKQRVQPISP